MPSKDNGVHTAILDAINGMRSEVRDIREEQRRVRDQLAAYHGDTVGAADCTRCQTRWVDRKYFTATVAVLVPSLGVITWLVGLLLK